MAGDWIKMRTDLYLDPRVLMIADLLLSPDSELARSVNQQCMCDMTVTRNVTRNATVGALVTVWGVARKRGTRVEDDLLLECATISLVDDLADLPGFGQAMESVGWLVQADGGVVFPGFFRTYNVDPKDESAEKNAERQRRHRDKKRNVMDNVTRNVTSNGREEKSREEKNNKKHPVSLFVKPTIEEVREYVTTQGYAVDPQLWMDHYEANGWRVGRNAMKDWRAAVRTWAKNEFGGGGKASQPGVDESYEQARKRIAKTKAMLDQCRRPADG